MNKDNITYIRQKVFYYLSYLFDAVECNWVLDTLIDDIISDVEDCSAMNEDGKFNDSDISIAIQRVLLKRLGYEE